MEKLSKKFYDDIESEIEAYVEAFEPYDYTHEDIDGTTHEVEADFELDEGYRAVVTLKIYVSVNVDRGDYDTPPYSWGFYEWKVTNLEIWDKDNDLVEVVGDTYPPYMEGTYKWG